MWKHIVRALIQILKAVKVYLGIFLILLCGCATTKVYKVTAHDKNGSIVHTYYTKEPLEGSIYQGTISFKDLHGEKIKLNGIVTVGVIE